jgi:hypothetical protein
LAVSITKWRISLTLPFGRAVTESDLQRRIPPATAIRNLPCSR